jgi:hypothetical protein
VVLSLQLFKLVFSPPRVPRQIQHPMAVCADWRLGCTAEALRGENITAPSATTIERLTAHLRRRVALIIPLITAVTLPSAAAFSLL